MWFLIATLCVSSAWAYAPMHEPAAGLYNDAAFIQDVLERMNRDLQPPAPLYDLDSRMDELSALKDPSPFGRQAKDAEFMDALDYDMLLGAAGTPSIRDSEYLQHSTLFGHKYPASAGSSGYKYKGILSKPLPAEPKQPDSVLPAYCNPPNPCPVGYTSEDGCIETFENSAAFSRAYQASQNCMCDTEHMFDCPAPKEESSNPEFDLLNEIQQQVSGGHKSAVAKKFHDKKSHDDSLTRLTQLAHNMAEEAAEMDKGEVNPFLEGEKLPIAAKKGHHAHSAA